MKFLMERGELKKRAFQRNLLTDAVLLSDSSSDIELRVITLTNWIEEQAYEKAWSWSSVLSEVIYIANTLIRNKGIPDAREFVLIGENEILVVVDVDRVDDRVMDYAVSLLADVDDFAPGSKTFF